MSSGHGSSRRQAYGRRMKELRARRAEDLPVDLEGPEGWDRGAAWDDGVSLRRSPTPGERERTGMRPR